jgi:RNA polymerase sigma factor (sigma-70 family)
VVSSAAPSRSEARQAGAELLAEQLYTAHRTRLLSIARHNSAGFDDAEEAVQDAFVFFIDHFDPDSDAPPLAWLTLTLKRRCWALYRIQQQSWEQRSGRDCDRCSDADLLGGSNRGPDDLLDRGEEIAAVRAHLAELKSDERRALSLLAFGYSYREICEQTGWSYTKVNRCLAEGRATLRELEARDRTAGHLLDV